MIAGIYNEKKENEQRKAYLNLDSIGDDSYRLFLVDEKGYRIEGGNLLVIKSNGSISRCSFINTHFGLNLDESGHLQVVD